jgi:hypothetical protein
VIPILLDHGADPHAQTDDGHTALQFIRGFGLDVAEKMAQVLISRGVATTPGKDSTCPECGAPESAEMGKRGVQVTISEVLATFACRDCNAQQRVQLDFIDKAKGLDVLCSCGAITFVPPSVWCKTCGMGLSTGWQRSVTTKRRS